MIKKIPSLIMPSLPRIAIAALRGGSGKTTLTLGIIQALRSQGIKIIPFKKGPDYIDPFWLGVAAENSCHNLDHYFMSRNQILRSFGYFSRNSDAAVVEGNRGLFDGLDEFGSYSTAELAKILSCPVLLVIDCNMASRTTAATVLGCQNFDPSLILAGVVLNSVANSRQETIIRRTIEDICEIPVLGAIPRLKLNMPERHMGLIPPQEHSQVNKILHQLALTVGAYLDLNTILAIMYSAPPWQPLGPPEGLVLASPPAFTNPIIGVVRDSVFGFYYPENLEALVNHGAKLVFCSALADTNLPNNIDALYLGGGFPEIYAEALTANYTFRQAVRRMADIGLPIYAECGGLIYLGRNLVINSQNYPMVGVFPIDFIMQNRPQGHGYTSCLVTDKNPFLPLGCLFRAHEFHYSKAHLLEKHGFQLVFKVLRGQGLDGRYGGILYKKTLGTYHHIHALSLKEWAPGLVAAALKKSNF